MRERDRELFLLYQKQGWLTNFESQTESLLALAEDEDQRKLLLEVLSIFHYVSSEQLESFVDAVAKRICTGLGVLPETAQIVSTAFDNEPDSSQMLLQMVRQKLPKHGGAKFRLRAKGMSAITDVQQRPHLIVVDEFAGTGKTIVSRVKSLHQTILGVAKQKKITIQPKITVCLLAAMTGALKFIREAGITVHAELELKSGITDRNPELEAAKKCITMRKIEERLDQARMNPFPSLGYDEVQAAFAIAHINAPNSNFPIFWWRHLADKTEFKPLLERNEPKYDY